MFEAGAVLKAQYGADNVYDFSLGNPDLPPPPQVAAMLHKLADTMDKPMALGYMPNAGYPQVREALAAHASREQGVTCAASDLVVTCGAAGGINAFFRAVLERGERVLAIAPYFVEYGAYVANHGGVLDTALCNPEDFSLDFAAIEAALAKGETRALILNSPNNPTGQVYSADELKTLGELLRKASARQQRPVFLLCDEPYRFLAYDGLPVPSTLPFYEYTVVITSFSKNLALAGERVGYVLVHPDMPGKQQLMEGLILANRILGYVNAPALGQLLAAGCLDALANTDHVSLYQRRRDLMADVLRQAGVEFVLPKGAFYFFPKAPGGDDLAYVAKLQAQRILAVPGRGFGLPGYIRLAYCVDEAVIEGSREGFLHVSKEG
ncbi:pyridoxal phosphate-dependent aminotransferase [Megalodesulfovibrio paquesii]